MKGGRDYYEKRHYFIGAFIEIGEKGWRIAGYDIPDSDIIPLTKNSGQESIHCENYISPLLSFGEKHKIRKRNNAGFRQKPEFILRVLKDDS